MCEFLTIVDSAKAKEETYGPIFFAYHHKRVHCKDFVSWLEGETNPPWLQEVLVQDRDRWKQRALEAWKQQNITNVEGYVEDPNDADDEDSG